MTRINVGMKPSELTDLHLRAEIREITRIPRCVAKGRYSLTGIPEHFKLGTGHVKFFYNKLLYLKRRYAALHREARKRKFNLTVHGNSWDGVPKKLMNDYMPTEKDRHLIIERITERINLKPHLYENRRR